MWRFLNAPLEKPYWSSIIFNIEGCVPLQVYGGFGPDENVNKSNDALSI